MPAGVSTKAPYKEAGDVLPQFSQAMFKHNQDGAVATALYYRAALNWATATNSSAALVAVCRGTSCQKTIDIINSQVTKGQHVVGQRATFSTTTTVPAAAGKNAEWVVQYTITIAAGRLVDSSGTTVEAYPSDRQVDNLYLTWSGKRWLVTGDFLAG